MVGKAWTGGPGSSRPSPWTGDRAPARDPKAKSAPIVLSNVWKGRHGHRTRIVLLALAVFVLDTVTRLDIVVPVLYVNVILLAMRSGRRGDVVVAGWGSIGLVVVSFLLTSNPAQLLASPTQPLAIALINNALSVLAIASVMVLGLMNLKSQTEVRRARDRIAVVSHGTTLQTLSTSVIHEVTQPLTAIGANAEAANRWLGQSPPNLDETKAATLRIVKDVERAANVIGRLRRSMARGGLAFERCDARALLEQAVEHMRLEIDEAGVALTLSCPHGLALSADRVLVTQVVINALSNAIDALRAVEVEPRAILVEAGACAGGVRIAIADSGVGADATTLEQMFDPFFTTKAGSGMGIGLAVSKSIVEAHEGTIRAFANSPHGLVVAFVLPDARPGPR